MMITSKEIITLLPVLILGVTVVIILLSIAYSRNQCLHAGLAIVGLCLAIISLGIVWRDRNVHSAFHQLVYIDNFAILYGILILTPSILSGILAYRWLLNCTNNRGDEFYLLLLISSIGGVLLTITNHLAMLFLGIELLSLPLFGLIAYSLCKKHSLEASIKYVILSGVSSSFLLLGMALIYVKTGFLSFTDIHQLLLTSRTFFLYQPILVIGLGIMLVGFGFKLSFVPFHLWTPDVYQGAPYPVSMYLATSSKIAIISVLTRFFLVFSDQYYNEIFYIFLSSAACFSILFGNLLAVQQDSIKRVLAYSSIAHTGYLLGSVIVLSKNPIVLEALGVYLISYLISNIGIFSIIGIMSKEKNYFDEDADSLSLYRGLFWKRPVLSVMFTIILLSLAGMPITLGFIGKFYLFMLGIGSKLWCVLMCMGIGSIIGMFYYLKIMINLYLRPLGSIYLYSSVCSDWIYTAEGIIVIIFTCLILFLGLYPQPIMYCIHFFL